MEQNILYTPEKKLVIKKNIIVKLDNFYNTGMNETKINNNNINEATTITVTSITSIIKN